MGKIIPFPGPRAASQGNLALDKQGQIIPLRPRSRTERKAGMRMALAALKAHNEPWFIVFMCCVVHDVTEEAFAAEAGVTPATVSDMRGRAMRFVADYLANDEGA